MLDFKWDYYYLEEKTRELKSWYQGITLSEREGKQETAGNKSLAVFFKVLCHNL